METAKSLTFLDIMRINLIRKIILSKISSFTDISNLAKTCKFIYFRFQKEAIIKNMITFNDFPQLTIEKKDKNLEYSPSIALQNIEFLHNTKLRERLNIVEKFFGEVILNENCIFFTLNQRIQKFKDSDSALIAEKLKEEISFLNDSIRKNAKFLHLRIANTKCSHHLMLQLLSFMNHQNIKRITIPLSCFIYENTSSYKLRENIFEGFPKLCELKILVNFETSNSLLTISKLTKHINIIEHVLKDLGKRKGATLIFEVPDCGYCKMESYVQMIFEIASIYKIKIKTNVKCMIPPYDKRNQIIRPPESCALFPIRENVTSVKENICNFKVFYNTFKILQTFKNLESLELSLLVFDIENEINDGDELLCDILSLKNCKMLKELKLYFANSPTRLDIYEKEIFLNNLKFICSLMPNTVKCLELINIFDLTQEITKVMSEIMPNIEIIISDTVIFKDPNCLDNFKNIKGFISFDIPNINIPSIVELLAIKHNNNVLIDNSYPMNHELVKTYSKKFSKTLHDKDGNFIFFNDIINWNMYKSIVQKNFIF
uniref:F-box domain-containing protein n=1 Tax=Strongyloides papillosus TaxID=174720 RepID=A0A0N5BS55_STREA